MDFTSLGSYHVAWWLLYFTNDRNNMQKWQWGPKISSCLMSGWINWCLYIFRYMKNSLYFPKTKSTLVRNGKHCLCSVAFHAARKQLIVIFHLSYNLYYLSYNYHSYQFFYLYKKGLVSVSAWYKYLWSRYILCVGERVSRILQTLMLQNLVDYYHVQFSSLLLSFERNLSSKSLVKEENCKNEFLDF